MIRQWASSRGFTIVEILISIVVIGILTTIVIVSYNGFGQQSRDSKRDSDVAQIKIALDKYYADNSEYPGVCSGGNGSACPITELGQALSPYLKVIPNDPNFSKDAAKGYAYVRGSGTSTSNSMYGIKISYEAKPVCKTGVNIVAGWWGTDIPTC